MEENERNAAEIIGSRRRERQRKKKRAKILRIWIIIFVIIISLGNIFFGYDRVSKDKTITVNEGSSIFEIAQTLKSEGVISKKLKFVASVVTSGNRGKIKYGSFDLKKGMTYKQVIELMATEGAKKNTVTLIVPEGFSVENIIERMTALGIGNEASIKDALTKDYDYEFLSKIPKKEGQKYRLQGFLFPSTYEFYADVTPEKVIDTLLAEFERQYKSVAKNYDGLSELITKAAMIEREAKIDSERPTIAGVFENRIKSGMKLQIDATVAYVVSDGKYDVQRILYSDLKKDSPYNTYVVEGLPIGPICNPGIESVKAALNPQKHEYLFYHTDENKKDGSHIFTKDFEEHKETMSQ